MLINIKAVCELLQESLAEQLNIFDYPAVLLDNNLKVIEKNVFANGVANFLRRGLKTTNYMPEGDGLKISKMITGDTMITSVEKDGRKVSVNIICGFDCYLMVLLPDSANLRTAVLKKYEKMSGYEANVSQPEPRSVAKRIKTFGMEEIIETALRNHMSPHPLPFFDSLAVIKSLLGEIERRMPKYKNRIKLSCPSNELIIEGDEKDFLLIIAFMISLCLDLSEKEVCVEIENDKNELIFTVSTNADTSAYEITRLASPRKGQASDEKFDESDFRAYMLKLLADGNLWDFGIDSDGGKISFALRTSCVKRGAEFTVRDVSHTFVAEVVENLFADSLK